MYSLFGTFPITAHSQGMLHPRSRILFASLFALGLGSAGCGSSDVLGPPPAAPSPAKTSVAKAAPTVPPGHLERGEVDRVLTKQGPPWLLRQVLYEEVLAKNGKFLGWRIAGLPEGWSAIDLRPGDLVKTVNGKPLETPDQAWEAWTSVANVREIRLSLERNGSAKEVVIPIDGKLSAETARALNQNAPPPREPEGPPRGVVRIGGDDASEGEDGE
jgi:hypothetical protein